MLPDIRLISFEKPGDDRDLVPRSAEAAMRWHLPALMALRAGLGERRGSCQGAPRVQDHPDADPRVDQLDRLRSAPYIQCSAHKGGRAW
jgi:hypothetical protein